MFHYTNAILAAKPLKYKYIYVSDESLNNFVTMPKAQQKKLPTFCLFNGIFFLILTIERFLYSNHQIVTQSQYLKFS